VSRRGWLLVAVLAALPGAFHWARHRPVAHAPGVLVAAEPVQSAPRDAAPLEHGDFTLTPLADFTIQARVLSRADYRFDAMSALVPTDLALGWGRMSDSAVLEQLDMSQSARFYTYRWHGEPPIPLPEIVRSSTNVHLIPGDATVERQLSRVVVGHIVTLRGQLVAAQRADGWQARSSLSREDTGGGACELLLVREVAIGY